MQQQADTERDMRVQFSARERRRDRGNMVTTNSGLPLCKASVITNDNTTRVNGALAVPGGDRPERADKYRHDGAELIYSYSFTDHHETKLSDNSGANTAPMFRPDGALVVFVRNGRERRLLDIASKQSADHVRCLPPASVRNEPLSCMITG
jgi:hypothetical protein